MSPRSRQNSTNVLQNDEESKLTALIAKKIAIQNDLERIESSIYAVESTYLKDGHVGNVVIGFKGYLNPDQRLLSIN
jgi:hypothetical protein